MPSMRVYFLILAVMVQMVVAQNYIEKENYVYVNNPSYFLNISPARLGSSGWVTFEFYQRAYNTNYDIIVAFDKTNITLSQLEVYKPTTVPKVVDYSCIGTYNYTANYFWCFETVSSKLPNETSVLVFEHNYSTRATNVFSWIEYTDVEWIPTTSIQKLNKTNAGNGTFTVKNIALQRNNYYKAKFFIDIPFGKRRMKGKYSVAIKPSNETIDQSIANNNYFELDPWYDVNWLYKIKIEVNGSSLNGSVTNWSMFINVSSVNLITKTQSDGDDIIFVDSDEATKLPHEQEYFNQTEGNYTGWVMVNLTNSTNHTIYMYYNNSQAANTSTETIWNDYAAVYHLMDKPTIQTFDSSQNPNNGIAWYSMAADDRVPAKLGWGYDCDGTDDGVSIADANSLDCTGNITISAWVYPHTNGSRAILGKFNAAGGNQKSYEAFAIDNSGSGYCPEIVTSNDGSTTRAWLYATNFNNMPNKWTYLILQSNSSNNFQGIWANATNMQYETDQTAAIAAKTSTMQLCLVRNSNTNYFFYDGLIDEVRVRCTITSSNYTMNDYYNQNNPLYFYSIGAEETAASDTCSCAGAGNNWLVDLSDDCVIDADCDLRAGGILSFYDDGSFTIDDSINVYVSKMYINNLTGTDRINLHQNSRLWLDG